MSSLPHHFIFTLVIFVVLYTKQIIFAKENNHAMHISEVIQNKTVKGLKQLFDLDVLCAQVTVQRTKKEFEGDFTVVVFPFVRMTKKSPAETGELL